MSLAIMKSIKQPRESRDYIFDLSEWFGGREDTLASVSIISPPGISASVESSGLRVKVTVSGGTAGEEYNIAVLVTTTSAVPVVRELDLYIQIQEL